MPDPESPPPVLACHDRRPGSGPSADRAGDGSVWPAACPSGTRASSSMPSRVDARPPTPPPHPSGRRDPHRPPETPPAARPNRGSPGCGSVPRSGGRRAFHSVPLRELPRSTGPPAPRPGDNLSAPPVSAPRYRAGRSPPVPRHARPGPVPGRRHSVARRRPATKSF